MIGIIANIYCFIHFILSSQYQFIIINLYNFSVEAWQCLERLRDSRRDMAAVVIQSYIRRWSCKTKWPTLKSALKSGQKRVQFKEPIYEG